MAVLGLQFCARAFSSCGKRGPLLSRCTDLSLSRPLLLWGTCSRRAGSVIVAHGPSCSAACGIFPDQGSNPCPLHLQADSQPLRHQGSPELLFLIYLFIFIFGCIGCLLLRAGFSLVVASRGYSSLRCAGFSLGGFSCCRAQALGARASVVVALGLSSCGSRAL